MKDRARRSLAAGLGALVQLAAEGGKQAVGARVQALVRRATAPWRSQRGRDPCGEGVPHFILK